MFNLNKVTIVFSKNIDGLNYYVPVTKISNDKTNKVEIIIKELKSSINAQNKLNSYLTDNIKLVNCNYKDNIMTLTFNKPIDNDSKLLIEESIKENYNVNKFNYEVKE